MGQPNSERLENLTLWQRMVLRRTLKAARKRPGETLEPEDAVHLGESTGGESKDDEEALLDIETAQAAGSALSSLHQHDVLGELVELSDLDPVVAKLLKEPGQVARDLLEAARLVGAVGVKAGHEQIGGEALVPDPGVPALLPLQDRSEELARALIGHLADYSPPACSLSAPSGSAPATCDEVETGYRAGLGIVRHRPW